MVVVWDVFKSSFTCTWQDCCNFETYFCDTFIRPWCYMYENQECPYVTKYARIVTEQSQFILANLANSWAITSKCLIGSSWLSNLAEIFCQQTFSQSVMIIQWKLFKLLSGHRWLHVFPYYVPYKNKHLMLLAYVFSSTLFLATQCWRNKYLKLDTLSQMP